MAASALRLEPAAQHYDWGSPDAIPKLLGRAPDGRPWAELWLGAHPRAPSLVERAGSLVPLDRVIREAPVEVLGARTARNHNERLPFLFKVLAAARPLSIQCHPDRQQARAGFAQENARGIPLDAPNRCYRDDSDKPELIVALTRFSALKGFRSPAAIRARLVSAGADSVVAALDGLDLADHGTWLRRFFRALMTLRGGPRVSTLRAVRSWAEGHDQLEARWVRMLLERYPEDLGVLAPLFLEPVILNPGQGLFLPPGELHAYVEGTGLEVMASSDNVLRGGLTSKHVDLDELMRVGRYAPSPPAVLEPETTTSGWHGYRTPPGPFQLLTGSVASGRTLERRDRDAVDVVLCTEGRLRLAPETGDSLALAQGQAALVPAAVGPYRVGGEGAIAVVTVP
jgi:mannose-6-phosphate isomerase